MSSKQEPIPAGSLSFFSPLPPLACAPSARVQLALFLQANAWEKHAAGIAAGSVDGVTASRPPRIAPAPLPPPADEASSPRRQQLALSARWAASEQAALDRNERDVLSRFVAQLEEGEEEVRARVVEGTGACGALADVRCAASAFVVDAGETKKRILVSCSFLLM